MVGGGKLGIGMTEFDVTVICGLACFSIFAILVSRLGILDRKFGEVARVGKLPWGFNSKGEATDTGEMLC